MRSHNIIWQPKVNLLGKCLGLLLAALLLVGIELISRLVVKETHLDTILSVLQRDSVLLWRNRANLCTTFAGMPVYTNSRGFRVEAKGAQISQEPQLGCRRIVCMGASPTFGWGVQYHKAYARRLEDLLRPAGIAAEVINAGMIGYSSHQGKLLLAREVLDLKPHLINDIDKYRFFRSNGDPDRTLGPESVVVTRLLNLTDRSAFIKLYGKIIGRLVPGRGAMEGRPLELYRPRSVRVPPDDYRTNLQEIVDLAKRRGITPVFIKMPVNLPTGTDPPSHIAEEAERLREQGVSLAERGECEAAMPLLNAAVELNSHLSEAYYFIVVCERKRGRMAIARQAFDNAMKSEAYRCGRDGLVYNEIMEEVARQHGVELIDVAHMFRATTDQYLFLDPHDDPIHPNELGHEIIGTLLFQAVRKFFLAEGDRT